MLQRGFVQEYIPKLQGAMIAYLLECPEQEIRKIEKEQFDRICKNLDTLLQRVYTVYERYKIMENFQLSMNAIVFKSQYLQRRIQGIKALNDICKNVKFGFTRVIDQDLLADWLERNNILKNLFGPHKHQQILQRSGPIVKFLYEKAKLKNPEDLNMILEYTKDEQLRPDVYKVLSEISFPLKSPALDYFAQKIATLGPSEICEEALDVIYEPTRYASNNAEEIVKLANVLFGIAFRKDYPVAISEKALNKYAEMVTVLEFDPDKKNILKHCLEDKIMKNENSVIALKLLRKIINQFFINDIPGTNNTRAIIIKWLIEENNFFEEFFAVIINSYLIFLRILKFTMKMQREILHPLVKDIVTQIALMRELNFFSIFWKMQVNR